MLICLLAVLKTGRAYVPIDPNYPKTRIDFIVKDADIKHVFVDSLTKEQVAKKINKHLLEDISYERWGTSAKPVIHPKQEQSGNAIAYVIYTSGSTGIPKGVLVRHKGASSLIDWAGRHYSEQEMKRVLASTSICFDLSVFELFTPLAVGGCVVIVDRALDLLNKKTKTEVTLINTVPSAIKVLLEQDAIPNSVITINLAGELLQQSLVDQLYDTRVSNVYDLYGPSEDTTYTTCALRSPGGFNNIGKPLPGTQLYILDQNQRPVPEGCIGELYIAGNGLSDGYLNRPELNTERFVSLDLLGLGTQRLYRTGDLARLGKQGVYQYLGRTDLQVKIRGIRIEIGEIEYHLTQPEIVSDASVVAQPDAAGSLILVAYLIIHEHTDLNAEAIIESVKEELNTKVPAYLLPDRFILLDSLPLTQNGKVDKNALQSMSNLNADDEIVLPETETELALCTIWSDLLSIPLQELSINKSLFLMGAHSLTVVRAVAEISSKLKIQINVQVVFIHSDIRSLAAFIDQKLMLSEFDQQLASSNDSSIEEVEW